MFVYGSLLFPEVLRTLVDRDPARTPDTVHGWHVITQPGKVYPTLVPQADGTVTGNLFVDLSPTEWHTLDAFEAEHYYLSRVHPVVTGGHAWAYATPDPELIPHEPWSPETFQTEHLADYLIRCAAWRQRHEASQ